MERVVVKRVYAASACGERRRLRGGTCERRMLRNARRSSGSSGHASGGRCRSVASGAVERVGASEASRGEAEPLRKRVTAQRGNERRGTSRFVGCGMGERGGEARPHHGGVRAPGGFVRGKARTEPLRVCGSVSRHSEETRGAVRRGEAVFRVPASCGASRFVGCGMGECVCGGGARPHHGDVRGGQ